MIGKTLAHKCKGYIRLGNNLITIQGNGIVRTISINKKLGVETRRPQVLVCYDVVERLINEKEDLIFKTRPKLFSINTIIISTEKISLLNVKVSKIRINEDSALKQIRTKVVPLTTKPKNFYFKSKISLEDKVYPFIYYHHNQVNIEMDETLAKI